MKVFIREMTRCKGQCLVEFSCSLGSTWAYWSGARPEPETTHDVEIEVPSDVHAEVISITELVPSLSEEDGVILLAGYFSDGAVRLGDTVVQLEDGVIECENNSPVQLTAKCVTLYPFRT